MAAERSCMLKCFLFFVLLLMQNLFIEGKKQEKTKKESKERSNKIGKDVRDYNDADIYKLLDQWDVSTYSCKVLTASTAGQQMCQ